MHKLESFLVWAVVSLTVPAALGILMLLLFRPNTP